VAAHRLLLMPGGNVGIGTNVPGARLDVNGNTVVRGDLTVQGTISTPNDTCTITVGPFAFTEQQSDMDVYRDSHDLRGGTPGQAVTCGYSLLVPNGATITRTELYFLDNASPQNVIFRLRRLQLDSTPEVEVLLSRSSSGANGWGVLVAAGFDHVVDSENYTYSVTAEWTTPATAADIQIYGLRITYMMP
jgi:hypothetical protein